MEANTAFKVNNGNFLDHIWMNRYMMAADSVSFLNTGAKAYFSGIEGLYNDDPNTFENTGHSAADMLGDVWGIGWTGKLAFDMKYRHGTTEAFKRGSTILGETSTKGVLKNVHTGELLEGEGAARFSSGKGWLSRLTKSRRLEAAAREEMLGGKLVKGNWHSTRGFIKSPNFLRDIAMMVGGQIAISMIGGPALGAAGRYIDQAHANFRSRKSMWYDNRHFDSNFQMQDTYSQVGMAMANYQQSMVSVARLMHAR